MPDYVRNMTYEQYNAALKERDAEIERLRAEADEVRRLSLALYTATTGPAVHRASNL